MQTLSEREEQRLLQGKDYVNLPELTPEEEAERWKELQNKAHQDPNLEVLEVSKDLKGSPDAVPFFPAGKLLLAEKWIGFCYAHIVKLLTNHCGAFCKHILCFNNGRI